MRVRILATAGVTGLLLGAAFDPTPAAAQQQTVVVADSSFMQMAGSLGLLQAKLAKMAEQKASSASVKEFGKQMTADYAKVNEDLAAAAKQAAFPRPVLLRDHQKVVDRFRRLGKDSFDKNYMAEVVKYQDEAARLYQQEAENGRIVSLKQMASQMLPSIQQHLALANETARSVGADVTASAKQASQGTH